MKIGKKKKLILAVLGVSLILLLWHLNQGDSEPFPDVNSNGVRDDVEKKILEKYSYGYSKNIINGLFQKARVLQRASSDINMTSDTAVEIAGDIARSSSCVYYIDPNFRGILDVEAWVVNSYSRTRAYNRFNGLLSGRMMSAASAKNNACDFEIK